MWTFIEQDCLLVEGRPPANVCT